MEEGVRPAGRSSLLAQQQDRKLDIHSEESLWGTSVCDSLILMSIVRVNTGLPGTETDSGHLLPVLPLAQSRVRHGEEGPCSTLAPRDRSRCVGDHPIGFIQLVQQLLFLLLR